MKIVCTTNMPFAKEAFGTLGDTVILPERTLKASDVRDADVLAVRSTTRVDHALIEGSRVRFVGTATIGFDHMDIPYLESRGIKWCAAPGCNANSVAEYLVAALLLLCKRHSIALKDLTLGIIGVGNVGTRVAEKAAALGMRTLLNDPPRQRMASPGIAKSFTGLDRVLAESDIVTLHVPLTDEGQDRTLHMAGREFFGKMKKGAVFFNCARGRVVDNEALMEALGRGTVAHAVLDTWDPEPSFPADLLGRVDIGTPHIAGHSFEGKAWGTAIVYREACRFLGTAPSWSPEGMLPPPPVPEADLDAGGKTDEAALHEVVRRIYDIEEDDRMLRSGAAGDAAQRAAHFDGLRRHYRERREFRFTRINLKNAAPSLASTLISLGFRLS